MGGMNNINFCFKRRSGVAISYFGFLDTGNRLERLVSFLEKWKLLFSERYRGAEFGRSRNRETRE